MTLEAVLQRREDNLVDMVAQTPPAMALAFVVEIGTQLIQAWAYVVVDYMRRSKLDQVCRFLDDDQTALERFLDRLMAQARSRILSPERMQSQQASGLCGLSKEDFDDGQRRIEASQRGAKLLCLRADSGTAEELARYAARLCGDSDAAGAGGREGRATGSAASSSDGRARSASPGGGQKSPRFAESGGPKSPRQQANHLGGSVCSVTSCVAKAADHERGGDSMEKSRKSTKWYQKVTSFASTKHKS